jgi:hypothetical protein
MLAVTLTDDAVLYALGASLSFLAFAALLDPRLFRTPIGQSLVTLDTGLVLLYVPAVLHRFAGLSLAGAAFSWYYLVTIVLVGSAVLWRTVIMVRAQWKGRKPPP